MKKLKLEVLNVWLNALIWTFWTIVMYGQLRMAGNDILATVIFIATPIILMKKD